MRAIGRAVSLASTLAVLAQGVSAQQEQQAALARYMVLPAATVQQLKLHRVRAIPLGDSLPDSPSAITDVTMHNGRIYVLDAQLHRLAVYDALGHLLNRVGGWGAEIGRFEAPRRLLFLRDTLLVVDAGKRGGLAMFDLLGRPQGIHRIGMLDPLISAVAWRNKLFVARIVTDTSSGSHLIITSFDHHGRPLGSGCEADPRYKGEGMVSHFALSEVAVDGVHIFCSQVLTPVIQVLDHKGNLQRLVTWAPPFYVAPRETSVSLNAEAIQQFRSTWTLHERTYPYEKGFLSIYSRYDVTGHRMRYFLFACPDLGSAAHCAAAESPGRPAAFVAPNTLVIERPHAPTDRLTLDLFNVAIQ